MKGHTELLAVTAPRSVELKQNVLVVVDNEVLERLSLDNDDITLGISSLDLLRLQVGLEAAGLVGGDEGLDAGGVMRTLERELKNTRFGTQISQDHGRQLVNGDLEVLENLGFGGRNVHEEQLALELLGNLTVGSQGRSMMILIGVGEEEDVLVDGIAKDLLGSLSGELKDPRGGLGRDELDDVVGGGLLLQLEVIAVVIEGLQHNNGVIGNGELALDTGVSGNGIDIAVISVSARDEKLRLLRIDRRKDPKSECLVSLLELFQISFG